MKQLLLGERTGLRVSELALGTGRLGTTAAGDSDPGQARRVLASFAGAGGSFIDTSSKYQLGQAEILVGAFLAEAGRDAFVIASKFGLTSLAAPAPALVGLHRGAMRAEVEGSLKRLGTDRIDLYFPHFDDGVTPGEEIMRGLEDLVRDGKIVHVGLSNFPAWRIASAATLADLRGWAPVSVLQLPYNLIDRDAEREHLPVARAKGLGVMGYSPLAGGGLTARLRAEAGRDSGEPDPVAAALLAVAGELGCEPASVALAWVGAHGIVPIIGPRDPGQLTANLDSVGLRLSEAQVARLDAASAPALGHIYDLLSHARAASGLAYPRTGAVL